MSLPLPVPRKGWRRDGSCWQDSRNLPHLSHLCTRKRKALRCRAVRSREESGSSRFFSLVAARPPHKHRSGTYWAAISLVLVARYNFFLSLYFTGLSVKIGARLRENTRIACARPDGAVTWDLRGPRRTSHQFFRSTFFYDISKKVGNATWFKPKLNQNSSLVPRWMCSTSRIFIVPQKDERFCGIWGIINAPQSRGRPTRLPPVGWYCGLSFTPPSLQFLGDPIKLRHVLPLNFCVHYHICVFKFLMLIEWPDHRTVKT